MTRRISRTSIRKVPYEQEWVVRAYDQDGIRFPKADYFASSFEDAFNTAKVMMKEKEEKVVEPPKIERHVWSSVAFLEDSGNLQENFYLSVTTNMSTYTVYLTTPELEELLTQILKARKSQYEFLVRPSKGISTPDEDFLNAKD